MTQQDINAVNKEKFLHYVQSIGRENADIDGLVRFLEESDFFSAPASTKYHSNFEGGLCWHSLQVYETLQALVEKLHLDGYSEDTLKIVALLHDLSKIDFYEKSVKNTKKYYPEGSKKDSMGNYDWVAEEAWQVKDASKRLVYGNHEMNSLYLAESFIPLTREESVAILHHMGGKGWDSAQEDITAVFTQCQLACLLHTADMLSTFIVEEKPF